MTWEQYTCTYFYSRLSKNISICSFCNLKNTKKNPNIIHHYCIISSNEDDVKGNQKKQSKAKPAVKESGQKSVSGGTVKPSKPFNPIEDSERLNEAMSGFGTDEAIITDILPHRTNDQRQEIKAKYQDKYNKVIF